MKKMLRKTKRRKRKIFKKKSHISFHPRKLEKEQIKSRVRRRNKNQSRNQSIHKQVSREYQLIPKDGLTKITIKLSSL